MAVGTPEGHHVDSPAHTRCVKYSSSHRIQNHCTDWKLSPVTFSQFNQVFKPLEVDLFASWLTQQLFCNFSWRPDPLAEVTDAFQQGWSLRTGYTNPPWCLMGKFLSQVMEQEALIILVAPVWKG